jgi:hypothetical protein
MNLLSLLNNDLVQGAIASQLGMNANDTGSVIAKLAPVLLGQAKNSLTHQSDGGDLLSMVANGGFENLLDNPAGLFSQSGATETGNNILSHLTGSKEQSRAIAQAVSNDTGVDFSMIKKILPILAPMVLGALNKQTPTDVGAAFNNASVNNNSITSMIGDLIDQDNDGSAMDDILGMAAKFLV